MRNASADLHQSHDALVGVAARHADDPTVSSAVSDVRLWIPSGSDVSPATQNGTPHGRRRWLTKRRLRGLAGVLAVLLIGAGVLYWRANSGFVKTNNAQTNGDLAQISPRVSGNVLKVLVEEHQYVRAGTELVDIDPTDYRLALVQAEAQRTTALANEQAAAAGLAAQEQAFTAGLNTAQGTLRAAQPTVVQAEAQLVMNDQTTAAGITQAQKQVATAEANLRAAQAQFTTAQRTFDRDKALLTAGAIAAQQMDIDTSNLATATAQVQAAEDTVHQARAQLASAVAARQQVTVSRQAVAVNQGQVANAQGLVQQAQAQAAVTRQRAQELAAARSQVAAAEQAVRVAQVNLSRTVIYAPVDGWVTNKTVEPGQVVQPNQPLMAITIRGHLWVDANIKEFQLGGVRVGDPVAIHIDEFHGHVFHGHVGGIGKATGSAVALLPPDNATGNFIKVVQLVPVRIFFDFAPGEAQPAVGLSTEVAIDTRHPVR
jgi:membrane fusion protein, multidrug efflux system